MIWTVLIASAAVYSWKLLGYLIPDRFINGWFRAFAARVTVALLVALVAVQTFASEGSLALDARVPALGVATVLFALRVPYIVVVIAAAATAALLRQFLGL
jgi:uncharacterized membrane protein